MNKLKTLLISIIIGLVIGVVGIVFAWTNPSGNPPTGSGSGIIQPGSIIMYSGAWNFDATGLGTGTLTGWALCNGNNGTPSLQSSFIMGAVTEAGLGITGGSNTHTITTSEMPSHTHTGPSHTHTFTGDALATHSHTFTGSALATHTHTFTGSALATHNHTFSGTAVGDHVHSISASGTHTHSYDKASYTSATMYNSVDSSLTYSNTTGAAWSGSSGDHSHGGWTGTAGGFTPAGTISSVSAGTPSGSISSVSAGTPSGSISSVSAGTPSGTNSASGTGATGSTGSGTQYDSRPAYLQLAFIKKL